VELSNLSASNSGFLTLSFTQPLHSTSLDRINKGLKLEIIQATSVSEELAQFTWQATSFSPNLLLLQITFENPLYISSEGRKRADTIRVTVTDAHLFKSPKGASVQQDSFIEAKLPAQMPQTWAPQVNTAVFVAEVAITSAVSATLLTNGFTGSLTEVWAMVNSI
jgi:hypothetical protein